MPVQRFFVTITILTNGTWISDLQMNGFHMSLKYIGTSKTFRTFFAHKSDSHVSDSDVAFHNAFAIEMCIAQVTGEPSFFLVSTLNVFFQVVVDCGLVTTDVTNFEIAFFWMTISHVLL